MWVFLVPYWLGVLVLIPSFSFSFFLLKEAKYIALMEYFNLNLVAANNIFLCYTSQLLAAIHINISI